MKVPVYDAPQAEARADVPAGINLVQPDNSGLQRGIDAGADALGKGLDKAQEQYEKFKHEARVTDVANGFAAYANDATDKFHGAPSDPSTTVVGGGGSTPGLQATPGAIDAATAGGERTVQLPGIVNPGVDTGFLGIRGKAAATAEQPLFESLQQRRDQIAAGFTDPETKKLFLARVQQYDLELRAKAEAHVGQQVEVAKQDAAANVSDAAVRGAAADPGNDKLAATLFGEAAGAVRGLGRGEDFEGLHDRQLRADIAGARLDGLLAPGPQQNVAKAREVLEANRGVLGKALDHYESLLGKTSDAVLAEQTASSIVHKSLRPDGTLNDRAALDALDKVPPELADNVRPILYRRMTEAEQAAKADTARVSQKAFAAFNLAGFSGMSAELKTQLNQRNPELYNKLELEDEMRWRRAKASKTDARRIQAELNRDAMNDFKALPVEQQAAIDLSPAGEFAQAHPGVDIHGFKAIAPVQRAAGDAVAKGQAVPMNQFISDATANAEAWLQPGRTPSQKQARAAALLDVKSKAVDAWNDWREAHSGKPPSTAEAKKLMGGIITKLTPTTDAEAKAAGEAIADQVVNAKTPKKDRALELKRQGKSNADIAKQLTQEGY